MQRTLCVLLLALLVLAPVSCDGSFEDTFESYLSEGFDQIAHHFGGLHLIKEAENHHESVVFWPQEGYLSEPHHLLDVYNVIAASFKNPEKYNTSNLLACNVGETSDYFKFAPMLVGTAKIGDTISFSSYCFANNTVTLNVVDNDTVVLEHIATNAANWDCSDAFFLATTQNYHWTNVFFKGTHKTTFTGLSASQMREIQRNGIHVFRVCDAVSQVLPDVIKTILLFAGGLTTHPWIPFFGSHPPSWMVNANIEFIEHATGYKWQKRANNTLLKLDPKEIHSGDFIAVTRFDGLDQIIEWGAGSHAGHSVIALWEGDQLYFLESQAAWYWPRENIQRNTYETWLEWASNAGYQVTVLPLKPEYRSKFNETKAWEFFKRMEGVPYGYHNFLFGWIDTERDSWPSVLSPELLAPAISMFESFIPAVGMIFNEAINFRLNTTNLTIGELSEVIYEKNLTWAQVYAMPEQDAWEYTNGHNLVCSSFVTGVWKAAGLFDDLEIQASEFTPRDSYSMIWIDPKPVRPQACIDTDPDNAWCQLMGDYVMEFPQLGTVEPYAKMNERCPSRADNGFFRPEKC